MQRPVDTRDAEPTTNSTRVPSRADLGLGLEHPAPLKPEHGLVREQGDRHAHQHMLKGTPPIGPQSATEDRTLRRRSTFDQISGLRSPVVATTAAAGVAKRSGQDEDLSLTEAYPHTEGIPGTRQPSDFLTADLGQKRAYYHDVQRQGYRDASKSPSSRTTPNRRPSRKESSPALRSLAGSGRDQTTMQQASTYTTTSFAANNRHMLQSRTLSPLFASSREQQAEPRNSQDDRLAKLSRRSSPYLARPHWKGEAVHDHAPEYATARTDPRFVRQRTARPHELSSPAQTPRTDFRAGLRHHNPTAGAQLQKMPSSPAVLRRAPGMANDHSRHRSPSLTGACGYCELEGGVAPATARASPLAQVAMIAETRSSDGNNNNNLPSPRESYHTAELYTCSSRSLRRIRDTRADLRGSTQPTSTRSSVVDAAGPELPPSSAGTGTVTPAGYIAGRSPLPPPPVPAGRHPDDHNCE